MIRLFLPVIIVFVILYLLDLREKSISRYGPSRFQAAPFSNYSKVLPLGDHGGTYFYAVEESEGEVYIQRRWLDTFPMNPVCTVDYDGNGAWVPRRFDDMEHAQEWAYSIGLGGRRMQHPYGTDKDVYRRDRRG